MLPISLQSLYEAVTSNRDLLRAGVKVTFQQHQQHNNKSNNNSITILNSRKI